MPVVPMPTRGPTSKGPKRLQDIRSPPSTPFAMMAAAQMHSEGRLLPDADLPPQLGGKEPT